MTLAVSRELIRSYFQACVSREPDRIAAFLDDNVTWTVTGPVDVLPFCGRYRGKTIVVDLIVRQVPAVLRLQAMHFEEILIDGDRAATFMRLNGMHGETGRTVSYDCAQFLRFRDHKLVEFRGLFDSFDAAEQMLGHPIEVAPHAVRGNVFAV